MRSFASLSEHVANSKPLSNVRKQLWEFYFSTGRGANALFEAIDLDENRSVEPAELKAFMIEVLRDPDGEEIDPTEIMPYAWNRLEQRETAGQSYDIKAFKKWLVAATKMSADTKNTRLMQYLSQHPQIGEQYYSDAEEDQNFTWNEETMSQSLRRMQYAVRGEVSLVYRLATCEGRVSQQGSFSLSFLMTFVPYPFFLSTFAFAIVIFNIFRW